VAWIAGDAVVLGGAVVVAGHQVLVARARAVPALEARVCVQFLALAGGGEFADPALRVGILDAPRNREALADRGAAVTRGTELAHQLVVHFGVGKTDDTRAAAFEFLHGGLLGNGGRGLRHGGQRQAGGGRGDELASLGRGRSAVSHGLHLGSPGFGGEAQ